MLKYPSLVALLVSLALAAAALGGGLLNGGTHFGW